MIEWRALFLTLKLALVVCSILLVIGMPIAAWLSFTNWRWKFLIEAVVALPLVLPPTVLGFYVLVALGSNSPIGRWYRHLTGHGLAFTFEGLAIGLRTFFRIVLPLSVAGVITGTVLSFAHTLGEFGVVLMVGGNIPGVTETISIAIYDKVQALDYASANRMALLLMTFSFVTLSITYAINRRVWAVWPMHR